jgi:hypothetical protein
MTMPRRSKVPREPLAAGVSRPGLFSRGRSPMGGRPATIAHLAPSPNGRDPAHRVVAARGDIAAFQLGPEPSAHLTVEVEGIVSFDLSHRDGVDGALFFMADSGEPFAFEPAVWMGSTQSAWWRAKSSSVRRPSWACK